MISQMFSHHIVRERCVIFLVGLLLILTPALAAKEEQLKLKWSELGQAVEGKKVIVALTDGVIIEGQILDVGSDALRIDVKVASNPQNYPKGQNSVRRPLVSVVRLKEVRGNRHRGRSDRSPWHCCASAYAQCDCWEHCGWCPYRRRGSSWLLLGTSGRPTSGCHYDCPRLIEHLYCSFPNGEGGRHGCQKPAVSRPFLV